MSNEEGISLLTASFIHGIRSYSSYCWYNEHTVHTADKMNIQYILLINEHTVYTADKMNIEYILLIKCVNHEKVT